MLASLAAAAISASGIAAMMLIGARAHRLSAYVSAFAVGLLTMAVIFHLLPKGVSDPVDALLWTVAGFALMGAGNIVIQLLFARQPDSADLTFGYASILALGVHSLLDGAVYTASFQETAIAGLISVAALLVHEFPEGVIAYLLLQVAGLRRMPAALGAFFTSGVTTVIGTLGGYAALGVLSDPSPEILYSGAAGVLIYVLLVHLIPHAGRTPKRRGYAAASLGAIIGTTIVILESFAGH